MMDSESIVGLLKGRLNNLKSPNEGRGLTEELLETIVYASFFETYPKSKRIEFKNKKKEVLTSLGCKWVSFYDDEGKFSEECDRNWHDELKKNPSHFFQEPGEDIEHLQENLIHKSEFEFALEVIYVLAETLLEERIKERERFHEPLVEELKHMKNSIDSVINRIEQDV